MAPESEAAEPPPSLSSSYNEKTPSIDWEDLRRRSLQPGGFGPNRVEIWPQLLHVSPTFESEEEKEEKEEKPLVEEHRDERQIRLDTDRSFVLYPVDTPLETREVMQTKLNQLLVSVFRRRPRLNYFQGYHDIISLIFLTLPEEMQLACAEQISLHRVRDSMGATLEPVLGLLRVTKNLLRLADPQYAQALERASPLPFYALSNLLTLFSHDMPTLPLIQHVFDYILCRPPIIIVYLASAIILSKKEEIWRLEEQDEDEGMGMAHSLLSSLPGISDGVEGEEEEEEEGEWVEKMELDVEVSEMQKQKRVLRDLAGIVKEEQERVEVDAEVDTVNEAVVPAAAEVVEEEQAALDVKLGTNVAEVDEKVYDRTADNSELTSGSREDISLLDDAGEELLPLSPPASKSVPRKATPSPSRPSRTASTKSTPSPSRSRPISPPPPPSHPPQPTLSLTSLLEQADALYTLYPPTHPSLALSSIMGPQSVVHTWSESRSALPGDDEAEAMVARPGLVVYPFIEEDEDVGEDDDDESREEEEEEGDEKSPAAGKRKRGKRIRGRIRGRLRKLRSRLSFGLGLGGERKRRTGTMVAGAVLVLGVAVAVAVYGGRMRGVLAGAGVYGFGAVDGRGNAHGHGLVGQGREWRKVAAWVGGAVAGATERVFSGMRVSSSSSSSPPSG